MGAGSSGNSITDIGTADTSSFSGQIEDKPFPIPPSLSETGVLWDEILVSIIIVISSVAIYFIIRYFLNRAAYSLQLERGQLKGILL